MHVITRRKLLEFAATYPGADVPLDRWYRIVKRADWGSFAEVRADFPAADAVGDLVVFDVGGNKFRLIAEVNYGHGRVYIRHVLTHKDYDKGRVETLNRGRAGIMATGVEATGERYMELVRAFPLRPIRDEAGLGRAIAAMDGLIDRGASNRIPEEDDYMFVLGTLIEQYEDAHHRMPGDDEGE